MDPTAVIRRLAAALLACALLLVSGASYADDFIVYSPYVTKGQNELEIRGIQQRDGNPALDGARSYEVSIAHAVTGWWRPEIYLGEYQRTPGSGQRLVGNEFENVFQLTPQGEYWADLGLLLSYGYSREPGVASTIEFGPLLEKQSGRIDQRLNLIWEKQVGGGADNKYALRTACSLAYRVTRAFAPGFEAYLRPADNAYQAGPIVRGELVTAPGSELEYRFGVVFGLNAAAPQQTFIAQLEYEFF